MRVDIYERRLAISSVSNRFLRVHRRLRQKCQVGGISCDNVCALRQLSSRCPVFAPFLGFLHTVLSAAARYVHINPGAVCYSHEGDPNTSAFLQDNVKKPKAFRSGFIGRTCSPFGGFEFVRNGYTQVLGLESIHSILDLIPSKLSHRIHTLAFGQI